MICAICWKQDIEAIQKIVIEKRAKSNYKEERS